MALIRWYLYGMVHDPTKRVGVCPRCATPYEGAPDEWGVCQVCTNTQVHCLP